MEKVLYSTVEVTFCPGSILYLVEPEYYCIVDVSHISRDFEKNL